MTTISMVPKEYYSYEMEHIKEFLGPAIDRSSGRWEFPDLITDLQMDRQQLWMAFNGGEDREVKGMVTTMVREYPRGKVVEIVFAGGEDHMEWLPDFFRLMKKYAKDLGCLGVEGVARKGFAKVFEQEGFKRPRSVYEYFLED